MAVDPMFEPIDPTETPHMPPEEQFQPTVPPPGSRIEINHFKLGKPSAVWPYYNEAGLLDGYVCRFETTNSDGTPGKTFLPYRHGGLTKNGQTRIGWHWKGWKDSGTPFYGRPELLARPKDPVLIVEGEKKVDAARRIFPDYVPISPMNGAKSPHKSRDWPLLAGRSVVIWPDADGPGSGFADATAKLASDAGAASVADVMIPDGWPGKWDLADALPDGVSPDVLVQMLKSAEPRIVSKPARPSQKPQRKLASEREITREVCRLVTLSPVKYVIERGEVAQKLGIGISQLDGLVKLERGDAVTRSGGDKAAGSGRPVGFPEIDPWPEPVDGAELLTDLSRTMRKYVILTQAQGDGVALWVMQTHLFDVVEVAPKLLIKSVMMRSGKTRLLGVLARLVPRPQATANIKAATLFRVIEEYRPTLLLDEVDTYLKDDPELHGIINSGFDKAGAKVLRLVPVGEKWEAREFSTWCPQAIAGIGRMPHTITDRSFVIEMKRKLRTEKVARLRRRDGAPLIELARKAARWAADHATELAGIEPKMPESLNDRAMDAWEFCIAIADLAGGEWPVRARTAARELSGDGTVEDDSIGIKLLADIRDVFANKHVDRLWSDDIVACLVELEGRPWSEWGRQRKQISKNQLADLLSPLHVTPQNVRIRDHVRKGYYLSAFRDPFARYLPPIPVQNATPLQSNQNYGLEPDFGRLHGEACSVLENGQNPSVSEVCSGVEFQTSLSQEKSENGIDRDAEFAPVDGPKPGRGRIIL